MPWYRDEYDLYWGDYGSTYWHGALRWRFDRVSGRELPTWRRAGDWVPKLSDPGDEPGWRVVMPEVLAVLDRTHLVVVPLDALEIVASDWHTHWRDADIPPHLIPFGGEPESALHGTARVERCPSLFCVRPRVRLAVKATADEVRIESVPGPGDGVCFAGRTAVWLFAEYVATKLAAIVDPEVRFAPVLGWRR